MKAHLKNTPVFTKDAKYYIELTWLITSTILWGIVKFMIGDNLID